MRSAAAALEEVGVEELQETTVALIANVVPNLQHNEGATSGGSTEVDVDSDTIWQFKPSRSGLHLTGGTGGTAAANRINKFNDSFETDEPHVVDCTWFWSRCCT